MSRTSTRTLIFRVLAAFTVMVTLTALLATHAAAQDDLDIPGLTPTVQETPATSTLDVGVTEQKVTLWGMIKSGGWCMWPLGAFSIALVALIIYNVLELREPKFCPLDLVAQLKEKLHYAQVQNAYDIAHENPSYLGQLFAHGISHADLQDPVALGRERIDSAMQDFANKANRTYMLWINYFSILAQSAPMLGLLGTVSGMIKAFSTMGREGMGDPSKLATNISEALITTATGLTIAIPALFCFFVFRNRLAQLVGKCNDIFDEMLLELLAAVAPGEDGASGPQA